MMTRDRSLKSSVTGLTPDGMRPAPLLRTPVAPHASHTVRGSEMTEQATSNCSISWVDRCAARGLPPELLSSETLPTDVMS